MRGPLLAAVLSLLLGPPARASSEPREPLEAALLRSVQMGSLQVEAAAALRHARAPETDFAGHVLARAALAVGGRDEEFAEWPLARLLQRALDLLTASPSAPAKRPSLPDGLGDAELVFTLVYAMTVSGQASAAEDVLEANLNGASRFKEAVALQSLRNIGDARSTNLIQRSLDGGADRQLVDNLLADLQFPFLYDLRDRLHLIPPAERTRGELRRLAAGPPGERTALAVYFLGFLGPAPRPSEQGAELTLLRRLVGSPHFMVRYFAVRALALRSRETVAYWADLLERQDDPWQRAQTARIGFALHGRAFARTALHLLDREPSQYVQWELMQGNVEVRRGHAFRTAWDVWLPPTLLFRLNFAQGASGMESQDVDELLAWLEGGARPRDEWVRNHLFRGLAHHVHGPNATRFLRQFAGLPDRRRHYWILDPLPDPAVLPVLRQWLDEPIPDAAQREELERLVRRLEAMPGATPAAKVS